MTFEVDHWPLWAYTYMYAHMCICPHEHKHIHTSYNIQNAVSFMGHGQRQLFYVPSYWNDDLVVSQVGYAMRL